MAYCLQETLLTQRRNSEDDMFPTLTATKCFFLIQLIFGSCGQPTHNPQAGLHSSHHYAAIHRHHLAGIPIPRPDPRVRSATLPTLEIPRDLVGDDKLKATTSYPFVWKGHYALPSKRVQIWASVG